MKREGTIGVAALLAIAAVAGFSLQTGPKPEESGSTDRSSAIRRSKPTPTKSETRKERPGCRGLEEELKEFLDIKDLILPKQCYESGDAPIGETQPEVTEKASRLKFVIATLPDPVHTHLPVLFDQFAVAIQEGAQDEKYDFDGSWLPWDDEEPSYALLSDEKAFNQEKEMKENQPGIILFRKTVDCGEQQVDCREDSGATDKKDGNGLSKSYREGLIVFVVGEEATHGIHREQFRNALEWIAVLQPKTEKNRKRLAVLGPSFSGSFPSLAQVLSEPNTADRLDLRSTTAGRRLAIYSGSVSGKNSAAAFQKAFDSKVTFHSFVQNDDEILERFCKYITTEQSGFDPGKLAMISEDETAYGSSGVTGEDGNDCSAKALKLFYPRDISALRGAYQTKSLFNMGTSPQSGETQRRNLPTDLADPAGKVHDSIRSYGGNQTPLTQEAFLLEIVAALRELHARYIVLRSSNTLDQLFLTNFLRRTYPDGRIVILGSDLMFARERGATGLSGTMTLSTYPLFPLERDWTEHPSLPASDRVFSADTTEGTYVALRLLLNEKSLNGETQDPNRCHALEEGKDESEREKKIFVPRIVCTQDPPIPDYSPPNWMLTDQGDEKNKGKHCVYPGPATWLSVIGVNRFWPMASLTAKKDQESLDPAELSCGEAKVVNGKEERAEEPGERPAMPSGMELFLLILAGFSMFHLWCCWSASYTAKPAFRAHFASTGDWRHTLLVFSGSSCVAFLAIVAAWGCGVFSFPARGLVYPWFGLCCVTFVCLMAWFAILANNRTVWKLSQRIRGSSDLPGMTSKDFTSWNHRGSSLFIGTLVAFCLLFVLPIQLALIDENRVLTYWRAMHLASGVSPIMPMFAIFAGLYLSFWFSLHGLALFGPDRPCLPPQQRLTIKDVDNIDRDFLKMFSQEHAAAGIERAGMPLNWKVAAISSVLFVLFLLVAFGVAEGVPVRSLGAQSYSIIFIVWLDVCCSLSIVEAWRLYEIWEELRRLLTFLDRLPLRRTLAVLHGFSWGSVWKMSGNVLEVRYKVISRQIQCMNHTIASLLDFARNSSDPGDIQAARISLPPLLDMRRAGFEFAEWYSTSYAEPLEGDLTSFQKFQTSVAAASGTLLAQLLVPAWRKEKQSLIVAPARVRDEKEDAVPNPPPQAKDEHLRNAEEFVCLTYLGFIQNVLGRLRTMALTIVVLFIASTVAISTYPFDPRQALSAVLVGLFVIVGVVIVKVYAEMHRDATLSHVTNTKPGELGAEFWIKIVGFGFAPLIGLLTRVFPGITDFVFSWLQPGISSLK